MSFQLQRILQNTSNASKLWNHAGRDNTINFHLDTKGKMHNKGASISNQEARFTRNLFRKVERITGLRFQETNFMKADMVIGCTEGSRWDQETIIKKYWFESYYEDYGGNRLTSEEKLNIAACVLIPLGLEPIDRNKYDTFDTVMSWNGDDYYGMRPADIYALREIW